MIALIDADSMLYKICFAVEEKEVWNEWEYSEGIDDELDIEYTTDLNQCYSNFDSMVDGILYATDCHEPVLVFSGDKNFRLDLPTPYKDNRKENRKPTGYEELLQYAKDNYSHVIVDSMEADDYVVWLKKAYPDDYVLCAIDKDVIYQSVGTHFNYGKEEFIKVKELDALRYAYRQTLSGDATDGYKGCPGIGEVKARKALESVEEEEEMWKVVVDLYEKKGLTEEDALLTMQLANMHQFDGEKIILWKPTFNETTLLEKYSNIKEVS